jgi:hypothetical protein
MRLAVRPRAARLGQRPRIALVRLHAPHPMRVHRRVPRIGDDHLVPELLQIPRHPLALRRRLKQDPKALSSTEQLRKMLRARGDSHLPHDRPLLVLASGEWLAGAENLRWLQSSPKLSGSQDFESASGFRKDSPAALEFASGEPLRRPRLPALQFFG